MAGIDQKDIDVISHGTTLATNITIEHNGTETGIMTSKGFRDIFHIGPHEPLKPSYQWTKDQSCTNFQYGPLK